MSICPPCARGNHADCASRYATGRMVPDTDPMRARNRNIPEVVACTCSHTTDGDGWRVGPGRGDGTVRITMGPVTVLDLPWRTAMDLAGVIANAAFKSARESGVPYVDAFEAMWLDTFQVFEAKNAAHE